MGLDDIVEFTGRVSDEKLLDYLNTADVCVNSEMCIRDRRYDLGKMAKCCQREAERYNVDNVMTKDLLKKVGLL